MEFITRKCGTAVQEILSMSVWKTIEKKPFFFQEFWLVLKPQIRYENLSTIVKKCIVKKK